MNLASSVLAGSLPKRVSERRSAEEYLNISRDPALSLDEKLTAIYTKAFHDLASFSPVSEPAAPSGFVDAHQAYRLAGKNDKSDLWKGIMQEFGGYIDSLNRVNSENYSNKRFLEEMRAHFDKLGMLTYSEQITLKLREFES